jgi:hypothetical protein
MPKDTSEILESTKKNIENSYMTFRHNYIDYNESRRFLYKSTLTEDEIATLKQMGRPTLEFNIVEAYVSRLCAEFAKQEPAAKVRKKNAMVQIDPRLPQVIEGIMLAIFDDAKTDFVQYETIRSMLSGGFDVWKIYTDYEDEMSFHQNIFVRRAYDPTLCGFDVVARDSSKCDGKYSFELFPRHIEEIKQEYGEEVVKEMKVTKDIDGFNWCFSGGETDIALIGDYYEKRKKKTKIVELVTGDVMTLKEYEAFVEHFNTTGFMAQAPGIVGKPRDSTTTTICHRVVSQNTILFEEETDLKYLPHIFFDGNSAMIRDGAQGNAKQVTRSYVKNAFGIQRLMNFSGQTLANELENIMQQKIIAAKRAIPKNYQEAYRNPQLASVLVYNDIDENGKEIPMPQIVPRPAAPPEIAATFMSSSNIMQSVLGSYDAALGLNDNQLSGKAISNGAMQSNSASEPYNIGYLRGWNQAAKIILSLIPRYMTRARSVPMIKPDGKRDDILVNHPQGISLNYSDNVLGVTIEAGVSFAMQQQQALNAMISLAKDSPLFAQFINQYGLEFFLDNIDIRGIEQLKQSAAQFMQQLQQQQAQQAQMPNPAMLKLQLEQMKQQHQQMIDEVDSQIRAADVSVKNKQADTDRMKVMGELGQKETEAELKQDKVSAEMARIAADIAIKTADTKHSHALDLLTLHHNNLNKQMKGDLLHD